MTREILFRGKREDCKRWIYGYYRKSEVYGYCFIRVSQVFEHKVIPETVGQYTGLTDKNGKKIFEGDIVIDQYPNETFGYAGYVCYNTGKTDFEIHNPKQPDIWINLGSRQDSVAVLGNIHDNPELLDEVRT